MSYRKLEGRAELETLKKVAEWASISEISMQAVKPIIVHLVTSYLMYDKLEEEKNSEIKDLLEEIKWLEQKLEEEISKNREPEVVIH